jgi:hypothetical protein
MSDDVTDGVDGDEPWILQGTSGRACAEEPSDAMDEGLETLEKEQKIKPRLCVCLEKQHLLRCMDEKVLRDSLRSTGADEKAKIRTTNGKVIKSLKEFPVGQKSSDAFKPEHGDTLANNHTQHNLALMVIQGIQGALSNQHFQQMNPNNRKKVFGMLVNSQKTSAGNICSKDASANDGPKFKEDTS